MQHEGTHVRRDRIEARQHLTFDEGGGTRHPKSTPDGSITC